jgi:ribosomal protein L37AE/L43A
MQKISDIHMKEMFDKIMHVIDAGHMDPQTAANLRERLQATLRDFLADQHGEVQASVIRKAEQGLVCPDCGAFAPRNLATGETVCPSCGWSYQKGSKKAQAMLPSRRARLQKLAEAFNEETRHTKCPNGHDVRTIADHGNIECPECGVTFNYDFR